MVLCQVTSVLPNPQPPQLPAMRPTHCSPFVIDVPDPQKDLVDPAVQGTRAVMQVPCRCPRCLRGRMDG
jgi:hypothetical protein